MIMFAWGLFEGNVCRKIIDNGLFGVIALQAFVCRVYSLALFDGSFEWGGLEGCMSMGLFWDLMWMHLFDGVYLQSLH